MATDDEVPSEVKLRMAESEARFERGESLTECHDCGIEAWFFEDPRDGRMVHEDFYVSDELWDAACPDDEVIRWRADGYDFGVGRWVLCIGCFEKRLGRRLVRGDFLGRPRTPTHDGNPPNGTHPSSRFRARWALPPNPTVRRRRAGRGR